MRRPTGARALETSGNPVRAANVLFISNERWARRSSEGYLHVAPELVVEILSPDDRWSEVTAKLADYFAADGAVVWIADPSLHKVFAYRQFGEGDLVLEEGLPPRLLARAR